MIKELHKAGIQVILDVVYNHTAEGNQMGPTLSFKGIGGKFPKNVEHNFSSPNTAIIPLSSLSK